MGKSLHFGLRRSHKLFVGQFKLPSVFSTCLREGHFLLFTLLSLTFIEVHKTLISIHEKNQDNKKKFCFVTIFFGHPLRVVVQKNKEENSVLRQGQQHGNHRNELCGFCGH